MSEQLVRLSNGDAKRVEERFQRVAFPAGAAHLDPEALSGARRIASAEARAHLDKGFRGQRAYVLVFHTPQRGCYEIAFEILETFLELVCWGPADVYVVREDFSAFIFLSHDDYALVVDGGMS